MSLRTSFFVFVIVCCVVVFWGLRTDVSGEPVTECRPAARVCEKSKPRPCQPSVCPEVSGFPRETAPEPDQKA